MSGKVGVAAVDDDVAWLQVGTELLDHRIDRRPGLDHQQDPAGPLQRRDEARNVVVPDDPAAGRLAGQELIGARRGPVIDRDREPIAVDIAGQIRPHHRQTDDADKPIRWVS